MLGDEFELFNTKPKTYSKPKSRQIGFRPTVSKARYGPPSVSIKSKGRSVKSPRNTPYAKRYKYKKEKQVLSYPSPIYADMQGERMKLVPELLSSTPSSPARPRAPPLVQEHLSSSSSSSAHPIAPHLFTELLGSSQSSLPSSFSSSSDC